MKADGPIVIALEDVGFAYPGGHEVLRGVSATLVAGRLTVLVGPNASGKSTLMKLMLGLLAPGSGRVRLCGRDIAAMPAGERARRVSYVPQRGTASFAFTVEQVVAMGQYVRQQDAAAVRRALEACDIGGLGGRIFAHLSGGQQQQVLIARALVQSGDDGQALLLDEPTSSLDLRHVHGLMRHLRSEADRGLAVLAVLHDLNLAARYADDVWLLDAGRLTQGPWSEVLDADRLSQVYAIDLERLDRGANRRPLFFAAPESGA